MYPPARFSDHHVAGADLETLAYSVADVGAAFVHDHHRFTAARTHRQIECRSTYADRHRRRLDRIIVLRTFPRDEAERALDRTDADVLRGLVGIEHEGVDRNLRVRPYHEFRIV